MSKKIRITVGVIILFIGILYLYLSENKEQVNITKQVEEIQVKDIKKVSKDYIEKEKVLKDKRISITKIEKTTNKNIPHYKDIFKEPKKIDTLEQIQNEDDMKKIDNESDKLISQADQFIKDNNLALEEKKLTNEQKEHFEEYEIQMDNLKDELKELSRDKSK